MTEPSNTSASDTPTPDPMSEREFETAARKVLSDRGVEIEDYHAAEFWNELVAAHTQAQRAAVEAFAERVKAHGKTPMPDPPTDLGQDTEWWERGYGAA